MDCFLANTSIIYLHTIVRKFPTTMQTRQHVCVWISAREYDLWLCDTCSCFECMKRLSMQNFLTGVIIWATRLALVWDSELRPAMVGRGLLSLLCLSGSPQYGRLYDIQAWTKDALHLWVTICCGVWRRIPQCRVSAGTWDMVSDQQRAEESCGFSLCASSEPKSSEVHTAGKKLRRPKLSKGAYQNVTVQACAHVMLAGLVAWNLSTQILRKSCQCQ